MDSNILLRSARLVSSFARSTAANVAITFALASIPLVGAVGAGVDFANVYEGKSAMQGALDSAALALVKQGATMTNAQFQTAAQNWFNASFKETNLKNVVITASYDATNLTATVNGTADYSTSLVKIVGLSTIHVSGTATAKMEGKKWAICVMITAPASNHTLKTDSGATIDFNNCMVQVDTQNWDAVEARDTSYIHSTNGDNCFVGDIHYGDITPQKDATCTFFPDPFASYPMPASAANCDFTNMQVKTDGVTLTPGTYCKGLQLQNISNVTFSPGIYIISGGKFQMQGQGNSSLNVTAHGVTFLLTGNSASLVFKNVNLDMTPTTGAGTFAGFLFFLDQTPDSQGNQQYGSQSTFQNVTLNSNGIIYLVEIGRAHV